MKVYEQVSNIIAYVAAFHRRLSGFYEDLADEVEKERVAGLLEYLRRQEERIHRGLKLYATEEPQRHDETRVQFVPGDEQLSLEDLDPSPDMMVNELVDLVMEMDNRLLTFYEKEADNTTLPPELRKIFKQLAEQQQQEEAKLIQTAEERYRTPMIRMRPS
jgi:rubrerythrin